MRRQKLAGTDLEIDRICLGTGSFGEKIDERQAERLLDCFLDGGGRFIDTANVYCRWVPGRENSSEQFIGRWLQKRKAWDRLVIATKGGHYDFRAPEVSRVTEKEIRRDLEESLRTLGLERIDLYWLHRDDPNIPVSELIDLMEELKREGKIRLYGASNFRQDRMEEAMQYARKKKIQGFAAVSNQWSIASVNPGKNMNQDRTLVKMDPSYYQWHERTGMPLIPFSSGAQGFFARLEKAGVKACRGRIVEEGALSSVPEKIRAAYLNERNLKLYELFCETKNETGISMHSLVLLSLMGRPFQVIPTAAASSTEQLEEILRAGETDAGEAFVEKVKMYEVE